MTDKPEPWRKAMPLGGMWENIQSASARRYRCGYCGDRVASDRGWQTNASAPNSAFRAGEIRVCPICNQPTYFRQPVKYQLPGAPAGAAVKHLPSDVERLYDEARDSHAAAAYTAAVLALRKLLMHVAVEKGAKQGMAFVEYVEYLDKHHYLGHDGKGWVDLIRTRGNEANHEIHLMAQADSEHLLTVAEMLLKLVYEFPGSLPKPTPPSGP